MMFLSMVIKVFPEGIRIEQTQQHLKLLRRENQNLEIPLKNMEKNDDLLQNLELILEETVKEALQQQESQFMILLANKEKKTKVWRKIAVAESLLIGLTLIIGISLHNL